MHTKRTLITLIAFLSIALATPFSVDAHAMPVSYEPDSSASVSAAPAQVRMRMSERLEGGASQITVIGPSGIKVSEGPAIVSSDDPRELSVPIKDDGQGTYTVSWSVVSSDDGHFTKGGYVFGVGTGIVAEATVDTTEVVQVTATPEVIGMTLEFAGNGLIWAVLVLFAFAFRAARREGVSDKEDKAVRRGYQTYMFASIFLGLAGAVAEIIVKAQGLAALQATSFTAALPVYVATVAGSATLYRIIALVAFLALFLVFRKKILEAKRFSAREAVLVVILLVFAYFRAKISHATANPFHPGFSVFVNFVHLIAKDMWAGSAVAALALVLSKHLRVLYVRTIGSIFAVQAVVFGTVSVTACYIVWLHLKGFGNLFATQWGGAFLGLMAVAVLLVLTRLYHVFVRMWRPSLFLKLLPMTLAAEAALSILVLYCSSAVLITSPPLSAPHAAAFSRIDQGVSVNLERDAYEDGMILVSTSGGSRPKEPVVTVEDEGSSLGPLSISLSKRFDGGYVFPASFLSGKGPFNIHVTVQQEGGYDAQASFEANASDFRQSEEEGPVRKFDSFSLFMAVMALGALACAYAVYRASKSGQSGELAHRAPEISAIGGLLIASLVSVSIVSAIDSSSWSNPFKALCVADGNMWHLMLPSKAGKPTSGTAAEGCMWGMGNYMYMFPDMREYSYYRQMDRAAVSLATQPSILKAGVPTTLTISLKEKDGTPATLFVDMEKLVHMVIVSEDETVFAHIHADDARPLAKQEIDSSTFAFSYSFPKAGKYLVAVDYAHGLQLESKQFAVDVTGSGGQRAEPATYPSSGSFGGYGVSLDFGQPYAGEVATVKYTISKDGRPVSDLQQYLSAAMHISAVKNDFTAFIHTHGEVHPPGAPYPPIIIKDGQVVHSMAAMVLPPKFGPNVEAHLIFPTAGIYTVWGEFKAGGVVVPTAFTVRVE